MVYWPRFRTGSAIRKNSDKKEHRRFRDRVVFMHAKFERHVLGVFNVFRRGRHALAASRLDPLLETL